MKKKYSIFLIVCSFVMFFLILAGMGVIVKMFKGSDNTCICNETVKEVMRVKSVEIPVYETLASCYDRVLKDLSENNKNRLLLNETIRR